VTCQWESPWFREEPGLQCRGITQFGRNGVFITCKERGLDVARNVKRMAWNVGKMIAGHRIVLIDALPEPGTQVEARQYDFQCLMTQTMFAVDKIGAKLVVLDSLSALFSQFHDAFLIRRELFRTSAPAKLRGWPALRKAWFPT
jgi:circadian clock protein KaiC